MVRVKGTCRICGYQGMLDPHHIISQAQARRLKRPDLITNPGNVVHICRKCHDLTPASQKRAKYEAKAKKAKARPKKKAKRSQCEAMTDVGSRCSLQKVKGARVCHVHKRLRVRPWRW